MKKAGIVILIIAMLTIGIYSGVTLGLSSSADVELYDGGGKPEARDVEIIYNSLMFETGNYRYGLQVSVDINSLTLGKDKAYKDEFTEAIDARLKEIKEKFADRATVNYEEGSGFIDIRLREYSNATELAIANGETGYDKYESSGTKYIGYFFSEYVVSHATPFAAQDEPTVIDTVYEILTRNDLVKADNIDLVYNYGTAYSTSLIRSDADYVYKYSEKDTGYKSIVHEYRMTPDTRDREMTLLQRSPNSTSWYIIVITTVLAAVGITLIVMGARKSDK